MSYGRVLPFLGAGLLALVACTPAIDQRGIPLTPEQLSMVREGRSTRDDVRDILGTPSSTANFGAETWYYISAKTQNYAFFSTEILEQKVVAISFRGNGIVEKVSEVDQANAKQIDPVERTTPTAGRDLGMLEQFLGNIGKFNKDSQKR
jgi:outer membrane protein assembly factor BamE (lipoprotein component of BamABCDE complex)